MVEDAANGSQKGSLAGRVSKAALGVSNDHATANIRVRIPSGPPYHITVLRACSTLCGGHRLRRE